MAMSFPLLPLPASVAAKSIRLAVLVGSVWSCFIALSGYGFGNVRLARAADKFGGKTSRSSRYRWTIGKIRRRSSKSASAGFRSPTAPMHERFSLPPALSSMTLPSISRQPALAIGASGRLMPDDVVGLFPKWYLRQRTEEQRPIGGEVGKWRSHL